MIFVNMNNILYLLFSRKIQQISRWRRVVDDIINRCLTVAKLVSPIVSHSSPEGYIPQEAAAIGECRLLVLCRLLVHI